MKPIDNENNYKPIWPEIKKIIEGHRGKFSDFDVNKLANRVICFSDYELINSPKELDLLRDTVIQLDFELVEAKKKCEDLEIKIMDIQRDRDSAIQDEKNSRRIIEQKYDRAMWDNKNLKKTIDNQTEEIISLKSKVSDVSAKLKEKETQNIIKDETIKKSNEDYKKVHHNEKYYKDSFLYMEKKYYRLKRKMNEYISKINNGHSFFSNKSDNDKKNVYTESQVQNPLDNISPHNPWDPSFFYSLVDFEIKMTALINTKKLERLDLFKKLIKCIWDNRNKEIFSREELWNDYSFKTSSESTMDRYLKLFVEAGMIESIGVGFYLVLF